jgi:D-amino-acid dehydrogenase
VAARPRRIAVVGAGIVGVATAYELAAAGHEVTVYERRSAVAGEGSFANAGVIAPALLADGFAHGLGHLGAAAILGHGPWLWRRWRSRKAAAATGESLRRWAMASRRRLLHLTRSLQLDYEQAPGLLLLLRGERELKAMQARLPGLEQLGVGAALVDAERARRIEPSLHEATALAGALHLPQDGVGNPRQLAHLLKAQAQKLGARFVFDTAVLSLRGGVDPELRLANGESPTPDHIVVCAGAAAAPLLAKAGVPLPLAAVRGHSLTAPVRHLDGLPDRGPKAALIDVRYGITISRLGQRVRVTAAGALNRRNGIESRIDAVDEGPLKPLYRVLDDWFPAGAVTREAQHWRGLRPTLPDGAPAVGPAGPAGLWLNLGHGDHGFMLACASAECLRAQIDAADGRPDTLHTWCSDNGMAPGDIERLSPVRLR